MSYFKFFDELNESKKASSVTQHYFKSVTKVNPNARDGHNLVFPHDYHELSDYCKFLEDHGVHVTISTNNSYVFGDDAVELAKLFDKREDESKSSDNSLRTQRRYSSAAGAFLEKVRKKGDRNFQHVSLVAKSIDEFKEKVAQGIIEDVMITILTNDVTSHLDNEFKKSKKYSEWSKQEGTAEPLTLKLWDKLGVQYSKHSEIYTADDDKRYEVTSKGYEAKVDSHLTIFFNFRGTPEIIWYEGEEYPVAWHCVIAQDGIYLHKSGWYDNESFRENPLIKDMPSPVEASVILSHNDKIKLEKLGFKKIFDIEKFKHDNRASHISKKINL